MKKTGIFVGTFDPFTIGHDSIVTRALPLFDRIVIGVGVNGQKNCMLTAEERIGIIESMYAGEPKIEVCGYNELTVDSFDSYLQAQADLTEMACEEDFVSGYQLGVQMLLEGIDYQSIMKNR